MVTLPARRVRFIGLAVAIALVMAAAIAGAESFEGTFGATSNAVDCGSVWHLYWPGYLNAASCTDELRSRLTMTAVLVGLATAVAASALWPRRLPWVLLPGAALAVAMLAAGRHFIWRVSGA